MVALAGRAGSRVDGARHERSASSVSLACRFSFLGTGNVDFSAQRTDVAWLGLARSLADTTGCSGFQLASDRREVATPRDRRSSFRACAAARAPCLCPALLR